MPSSTASFRFQLSAAGLNLHMESSSGNITLAATPEQDSRWTSLAAATQETVWSAATSPVIAPKLLVLAVDPAAASTAEVAVRLTSTDGDDITVVITTKAPLVLGSNKMGAAGASLTTLSATLSTVIIRNNGVAAVSVFFAAVA